MDLRLFTGLDVRICVLKSLIHILNCDVVCVEFRFNFTNLFFNHRPNFFFLNAWRRSFGWSGTHNRSIWNINWGHILIIALLWCFLETLKHWVTLSTHNIFNLFQSRSHLVLIEFYFAKWIFNKSQSIKDPAHFLWNKLLNLRNTILSVALPLIEALFSGTGLSRKLKVKIVTFSL